MEAFPGGGDPYEPDPPLAAAPAPAGSEVYMSTYSRLPAHQGQMAWGLELKHVLDEARLRGDLRPAMQIIPEWLEFRKNFAAGDQTSFDQQ